MRIRKLGFGVVTGILGATLGLGGVHVAHGQVGVENERRPTTPTVLGDTGLWFVPTAEVLPSGQWSASTFRVNTDRQQGFTDISHFAGALSIGIKDRVEVFGALNTQTRIDRDLRPLNNADLPNVGGADPDYPFVRDGFTRGFGDLSLGAKLNLLSEQRGHPAALAVRSLVKLPTGEKDKGVSTGETDVMVDLIASRYLGPVEVAGFGGAIARGDSDDADLPNGVRWGAGAGFPAPGRLRLVTEVRGEVTLGDGVVTPRSLVAQDGSLAPLRSLMRNPVDALLGLTWQGPRGVFLGGGVSWAARFSPRERLGAPAESELGDRFGFQMGLGIRPGHRGPAPRATETADPLNRPPVVVARCEPCTVAPGDPSMIRADATDPDGDRLNLLWWAPVGSILEPSERTTTWLAPDEEGDVVVTVEVDDDHGGRASDAVTIHVVAPEPEPVRLVFEDVHFDFDRATLRPAAFRVLDQAAAALMASPELRVTIDGHTCNIGTPEYNIGLADRRAAAVRSYLVSQGVDPARLTTVAYGEERPGFDNVREESRRFNRRAVLVVELTPPAQSQ